jgi:hypothetical protein
MEGFDNGGVEPYSHITKILVADVRRIKEW